MTQYMNVSYRLEDFIPIMHFGAPHGGIVVRADSPWKTLKEFVEYAKKNPGKVSYSVTGVAQVNHFAMEFIAKQEGIQWTVVPSGKDMPHVLLLSGNVQACSSGPQWIPFVQEGSFRLLATFGERRMKTFPDVPLLQELGYNFEPDVVFMFVAPRGTLSSIVKKLDEAFHKAMDSQEFKSIMERMEVDIVYRNSEETKKYIEAGYARVGKMIQELKIKKEPEKK